ncbi:efflux RND transporter permease subunit [Lentisphaerota bacterium ZTH]|nr:efflux RND transporter permease subunit [Lentisphaerota bacterium]WET05873.1 efflux RND transporter permease subunit [Lentisphaerota bacterium ZTH]
MKLTTFSIKRPVAMCCLILAMIIAGINSYRRLGLDLMPQLDIPYITITTDYPGATPEKIEVDVAKKIEDAVGSVNGLKHIRSTSEEGTCTTELEFKLNVNIDVAAQDVRDKLDQIINDLPAGCETPTIDKFDINTRPVVKLTITGDQPLDRMYDFAAETLKDRFSVLDGVANINVSGGENLEVHVIIDRRKLSAANLTVNKIIERLNAENVRIPSGRVKEGDDEINVTFDGEFKSFADMGLLEVGNTKDHRIYLRDVARVELISKEKRSLAFVDGKPAISIDVIKKNDSNAVQVVNNVKAEVNRIKKLGIIPSGMRLGWFFDDGNYISASIDDAWQSIIWAVVLTALILFAFLHEIRSTLIVAVSMPVSIIVTFAIMRVFNFTFNNSTLLALGTSVGVLVTNSIVVIENIFKLLKKHKRRRRAANEGALQVAIPVVASAMTNVVVFIPIALMTTLVGRYFMPFAITMTGATLVSLFISFTLTPVLASIFLRRNMPIRNKLLAWYSEKWEKGYGWLEDKFDNSLDAMAKRPAVPLLAVLGLFLIVVCFIVPRVGTSFFPNTDRGRFNIRLEFPIRRNIDATKRKVLAIADRIRQLPEVKKTMSMVGDVYGNEGQATKGVYLGQIIVLTSQKDERSLTQEQIKGILASEMKRIPGVSSTINTASIGGSESDLEMQIFGPNLNVLKATAAKAQELLEKSGMAREVQTNVRPRKPEIRISPKRTVMQELGLSSEIFGNMLRGNLEGIKAGTFKQDARSYDIRVQFAEEKGAGQVKDFKFMLFKGIPLNIDVVANVVEDTMPVMISRAEKSRVVDIYANTVPGVSLGELVQYLKEHMKEVMPAGYTMRFSGSAESMKEAQADFAEAIILAILLTYLLIAAILESWSRPLLIMFTIPLGMIGMFTALWLSGQPLSMMGLMGAIMLIGIVVNNAILIVAEARELNRNGMHADVAMIKATKTKFRPIVMISMAAILGIVPMAFGTGLGAELRNSCGMAVFGGLISSSLLSLYVIPLMFIQFTRRKHHVGDDDYWLREEIKPHGTSSRLRGRTRRGDKRRRRPRY